MSFPRTLSVTIALLLLASACNLSTDAQTTTPPTPTTRIVPPTATTPPSEHRIGVRVVDGVGEFYDRYTGQRFVPRGANYVRLAMQQNRAGERYVAHSTFGPGFYDAAAAGQALEKMHADGYNVVRVFLETTTTTSIAGFDGLSDTYMDNVVDFLRLAKASQVYVIFVTDWVPDSSPYNEIIAQECCTLFDSSNAVHLAASGVEGSRLFYMDFVRELLARDAPLEAVFSINVSNELAFDIDQPPLSWSSGTVRLGNDQTYDMAIPGDKQRMMDEGLVYYIDQVRAGILEVDPTALVGVGFFQPQSPNPTRIGDPRVIRTYPAIWQSSADYIDLHAYPGFELTLAQYVENYEINGMQEKPIMMGEFGAFRFAYSTVQSAAAALMNWQVESCQYGFDGWLIWTWDDDTGGEMYSALSDEGAINGLLAPVIRPDPCEASQTSTSEINAALGQNVTASNFVANEPPENVVDGSNAQWNSGLDAPQWIEIDLGEALMVSEIRLTVAQYPEGDSSHTIYVAGPGESLRPVHTFSGFTTDMQILSFSPETPLVNIRYVRIVTTASPSWVAWKEIEVFVLTGE